MIVIRMASRHKAAARMAMVASSVRHRQAAPAMVVWKLANVSSSR